MEQLLDIVRTESSKINKNPQQTKIFKSSSFSNRQYHCTTLLRKNGGTENLILLSKLSKEIRQHLLKCQLL